MAKIKGQLIVSADLADISAGPPALTPKVMLMSISMSKF
jgi:hypothetical protein